MQKKIPPVHVCLVKVDVPRVCVFWCVLGGWRASDNLAPIRNAECVPALVVYAQCLAAQMQICYHGNVTVFPPLTNNRPGDGHVRAFSVNRHLVCALP